MFGPRILIVGGGIAGLGLAALLLREGLRPVVIEKAPAWRPRREGIVLAPNALSVLEAFGADQAALARGLALDELELTDENGVIIQRLDTRCDASTLPLLLALHRDALHQVLLEACAGVELRPGVGLESLRDDGDRVRVTLSDGTRGEFELVVGADGLHSTVRDRVVGPVKLRYAGYAVWRMVLDGVQGFHRSLEMWGAGRRFGAVPIGGDRVYCWAAVHAPRPLLDPPDGRIARLRARFDEFGAPAQNLLLRLEDPEQLQRDDIEELDSGRMAAGRVVLIGDAAHSLTPSLGLGASMALEDAWVLSRRLREQHGVPAALRRFEQQRLGRVRIVRHLSRAFSDVGHWQSGLACAARAALLRAYPGQLAVRRCERLLLSDPERPSMASAAQRHSGGASAPC